MSLISGFEEIVRPDEPLARRTWFNLGGPAQFFAQPQDADQLAALVRRGREEDLPIRVLGGGSNVLVRDEGVAGLVIHLSEEGFGAISIEGDSVVAGGGARLGHVVSCAAREGLAGLEPLVGIPGSIGGALHNNSGSHGGDIGQWTAQASVLTRSGEILTRSSQELEFAYRQSSLNELVIVEARFDLEREDAQILTKRMQKLWIVKKAAEPPPEIHAGCIFKDAGGMAAESIIEQAGMKNAEQGLVAVSDQNANFLVAHEGAKTADALALIDAIRETVQQKLGIDLELAIDIW